MLACAGINALDPQRTEIPFPRATIAIGILQIFSTRWIAARKVFFERPREPLACLRTFLWRFCLVTPRFTRAI